jgi:hypothetical protein
MIKSKTGRLNENSPDASEADTQAQSIRPPAGQDRSKKLAPVSEQTHHGPAIYRESEHMTNTDGFQQMSRKMSG